MDARDETTRRDEDKTPAGDRSIPRGTDEHAEPRTDRKDDRSATTRPRSDTRDEADVEQDL